METNWWIVIISMWLLMMLRLEVAYRLGMHLLDEVHRYNMNLIDDEDKSVLEILERVISYDNVPSYNAIIFDMTLWTKKQIRNRIPVLNSNV